MLSVIQGIVVAAERNAAAPALITGARSISYGELLNMIARVSNHLLDRGLPSRAKLFINIGDPDLRLIVTIAALHAGLIPFALMDIGDLKDEVDHDAIVGAAVLQLPELAPDLVIDQSVLAGRLSDGKLRDLPDRPDGDILFVGSTTGTTGRAKLIAETWGSLRHKTVLRDLVPGVGDRAPPKFSGVSCDDRILVTFGDVTYAGVSSALQVLSAGATSVRAARDSLECLKLINIFGVTAVGTTPGTLADLMDRMDEHRIRCQSVRRITLVGSLFDAVLVERIERHFEATIAVVYGASEVGRISSDTVTSSSFRFGYVGELFPEAKLITAGTRDDPAPVVVVRNSDTYVPYYAKGQVVPSDQAFYTLPDLGYAEGTRLYLVGRDDEVYNISGNKIAFSAIDQDLRSQPGVTDVALVGGAQVGDPSGLIVAVVGESRLDLATLLARVCAIVKAPGAAEHIHLFVIDAVPRNAFGKIDRKRVAEAYLRQARQSKSG